MYICIYVYMYMYVYEIIRETYATWTQKNAKIIPIKIIKYLFRKYKNLNTDVKLEIFVIYKLAHNF